MAGIALVIAAFAGNPTPMRGAGGTPATGSIVLSADGSTLFVANPDSGTVSRVDTRSEHKTGEVRVGANPRVLALAPDGGRLYVSNQDAGSLTVIDTASFTVRGELDGCLEPYGLVVDPQGSSLYVACAATDEIAEVDLVGSHGVTARMAVSPRPKGLTLSSDGARLYATHFFTGLVSIIDTVRRTLLTTIAMGADANMSQRLAIHPTNGRAYAPHIRSNVTNRSLLFDTTVFPVVSVIDLATSQHLLRERLDLSVGDVSVNLPFDVAFSPDGRRLYVPNLGSGDLLVMDLATRLRVARIEVGDGPRGMAVSADGRTAYVHNSLSDDVSVVDLDRLIEQRRIPVTISAASAHVKRGKVLFFSSRSTDLARDRWISCATCHFDGEQDGRTWFFPSGPRNTTSLRLLKDTKPLHWSADRDEVQDFEFTIRQVQAGSGLIRGRVPEVELGAPNAGLSADLDALAAFVETLAAKSSPYPRSTAEAAAAQRGHAVFERTDVGCARCHPAPLFTDSRLATLLRHDVGTGDGPDERLGPAFDTPTLVGVWDTAPYLHDGSAATLRDVLTRRNPGDRHGSTSRLTAGEIDDLVAYLNSLAPAERGVR